MKKERIAWPWLTMIISILLSLSSCKQSQDKDNTIFDLTEESETVLTDTFGETDLSPDGLTGSTEGEVTFRTTEESTIEEGIPPQITSKPVTEAFANEPYAYQIITEGSLPITFSLTKAPPGMQVNAETGLITWWPVVNQTGEHSISIRASNSIGEDTQGFIVIVTATPVTIFYEYPEIAIRGEKWTYQPTATGTPPIIWFLHVSAEGATINSETGLITWTPIEPQIGQYDFVIGAMNELGSDTLFLDVIVVPYEPTMVSEPPTIAYIGAPYVYEAIAYGVPPLSWVLEEAPEGMTLEPLEPSYDFGASLSWTPTEDQVGDHVVRLTVLNDFGTGTQEFIVYAIRSDPQIISQPGTECLIVGMEWRYQLEAVGTQPITWSLESYPAGAEINPETGLLTWTPKSHQVGLDIFSIEARNERGLARQSFVVCVVPAEPAITSEPLTTADVGVLYTYQAQATGASPLFWILETAPVGMDVDVQTGLVSWTPSVDQTGEHPVSIRALNEYGEDIQDFVVTVSEIVPLSSFLNSTL